MKKLFIYFVLIVFVACSSTKKTSHNPVPITTKKDSVIDYKYIIPISKIDNEKLYNACYYWLKTPYKFGGNNKSGIDCSALINHIYADVYNKKLPRTTKEIYQFVSKIDTKKLQTGDLVFFNFSKSSVSHVGLFLADNKFIHASTSKGVIIGSLQDVFNKKHYIGAGTIK